MLSILMFAAISAAPAYDVSSWNLSPGSIPRINAVGDASSGIPVVSNGGIATDPAQVSGTIANLIAYPYNLGMWSKNAVAVTTDAVVCPDGSSRTTTKLTVGAGAFIYSHNVSTSAATQYNFSAWVWTDIGTKQFRMWRTNAVAWGSGSVSATLTATTIPQRFSHTFTTGAGETVSDVGMLSEGKTPFNSDTGTFFISEAQLELIGTLGVPGPFCATTCIRGEYDGQPSDPGILVPVQISDPRTWGVGISASKATWAGADALVDLGGQLSGYRWNSARLETTAGGALVLTVIGSTGASATRTVAAHNFADGSTHKLAFGAFDGTPFLLVDGVASGTLSGTAVLSSFPTAIGINSTIHPVAKTVYRVSQGPTPWAAHRKLK